MNKRLCSSKVLKEEKDFDLNFNFFIQDQMHYIQNIILQCQGKCIPHQNSLITKNDPWLRLRCFTNLYSQIAHSLGIDNFHLVANPYHKLQNLHL